MKTTDALTETDTAAALAVMRPQMLRFARLQLRSDAAAEDAVQEALLSAMEGAARFAGAAALRTWVFAILRNKIVDDIRRRAREPEMARPPTDDDAEQVENELFRADGHWATLPGSWANPESALEQTQFWTVFEACLDHLPSKPGRVFMMRELLGLETDEICKELAISASNCWVLLHRARLGLRECLSLHWFGEKGR